MLHTPAVLMVVAVSVLASREGVGMLEPSVYLPGLGTLYGVVVNDTNATNTTSGSKGYRSFRGVPYAKSPTGLLRWANPEPMTWDEPQLNATLFRPACAQSASAYESLGDSTSVTSEDCLTLSIYQPAYNSTPATLPVMIYFPSVDFAYGGNADKESSMLPRMNNSESNFIFITVQYRLGVFGFLGSNDLKLRSAEKSCGNYGIQDQRAAMQWVKNHIFYFGGDPDRITIWGTGSGASSVSIHLVANQSQDLFSQAIIESGAFNLWNSKPMDHAEEIYQSLANSTGCNTAESKIECLLGLNTSTLLNASDAALASANLPNWLVNGTKVFEHSAFTGVEYQWGPVVDDVELLDQPQNSIAELKKHKLNAQEVMLGTDANEGSPNMPFMPSINLSNITDKDSFTAWVADHFGQNDSDKITELYYPDTPGESGESAGTEQILQRAAADAWGDWLVTCPTRRASEFMSNTEVSVYLYCFAHSPNTSVNWKHASNSGAFHGSEIAFVMLDTFELLGPGETEMALVMNRFWGNFAATGDPNKPTALSPFWPTFDAAPFPTTGGVSAHFEVNNVTTVFGLKKDQCDFWTQYSNPWMPWLNPRQPAPP